MEVAYDEPNEETIAAINEVKSGKKLEKLDLQKFKEFLEAL